MINCRNVHCNVESHRIESDTFMLNILGSLESANRESLPSNSINVSNNSKKKIIGWNQDVKPFKEEADFWHSIWLSAGRPINNELHNLMKKSKNKYHFQIRKCKKAEYKIKRNKLLDAFF